MRGAKETLGTESYKYFTTQHGIKMTRIDYLKHFSVTIVTYNSNQLRLGMSFCYVDTIVLKFRQSCDQCDLMHQESKLHFTSTCDLVNAFRKTFNLSTHFQVYCFSRCIFCLHYCKSRKTFTWCVQITNYSLTKHKVMIKQHNNTTGVQRQIDPTGI